MKIAKRCVCCGGERLVASPAILMPFLAHRIFGWDSTEVTAAWNLRDLAPGRVYSLCKTLDCAACGAIFLDMRFDDEEMGALYHAYRGPDYCAMRERFEPGYARRNAALAEGSPSLPQIETLLAPHLGPRPRVLDWGGDTGLNTPFRGRCAAHHIYDISDKPVIAGAERVGLEQARAGRYDLVVSAHVLEHVSDPTGLLREMTSAMTRETILYLEFPHEELMRRADRDDRASAKRHWHEHINFFSEAAIDAMTARAGLAVLERVSHPVSAGGATSQVFSVIAKLHG
ncbi:class I SAM-dependent methyltransferase [Methylobacterium sp. BTF04]|uniref:class I SAM-dependent methyltransferase n=1 Tax=Methylobacterium sp. BTF04 TaxID=2708300 RepID=UPI0013D4EFDF|nr:class I SAM-dependent methyltransferase [Methylobacterium sp. BTF04]NEU12965.1 class I SAM-dependent methyltransferase [Methylobacterium sp. BTF04]